MLPLKMQILVYIANKHINTKESKTVLYLSKFKDKLFKQLPWISATTDAAPVLHGLHILYIWDKITWNEKNFLILMNKNVACTDKPSVMR